MSFNESRMPKLVFQCVEPDFVPADVKVLIHELQNIGFIGEKWQTDGTSISGERYLIGERFLSLVTFMGCAPAIELEPSLDPATEQPDSTEFCHIEIEPIEEKIKFIRGSDFLISRCPHCRQRHANWQSIPENLLYACDKCKVETHLSLYDWKNTAGCGRFFISLHGIYPQEAIPTSHLLQSFENITGKKWTYFYVQ